MRHGKLSKKRNRDTSLRKATIRGIVSGLILHQRVRTTVTKAKLTKRLADKLITFGKRGDIGAQNQVMQILHDKLIVQRLFKEIAPLFKSRNGGYTRVILDKTRPGDGAMMAYLEFTEKKEVVVPVKSKSKSKSSKETKPSEDNKHVAGREDVKTLEEKVYHPKKDEDKDIVKEEIVKEKAKSETKQIDKGFFEGFKRYFRSNPRKGS